MSCASIFSHKLISYPLFRDGLEYCWCSSRDLCNSSPESILSKQYFVYAINAALVVTFLWYQKREDFCCLSGNKMVNWKVESNCRSYIPNSYIEEQILPNQKTAPHYVIWVMLCVTHVISQFFVGLDLVNPLYSECRQADHFDQPDHQTAPTPTINCKICNKFGPNRNLQNNILQKMRLEQ